MPNCGATDKCHYARATDKCHYAGATDKCHYDGATDKRDHAGATYALLPPTAGAVAAVPAAVHPGTASWANRQHAVRHALAQCKSSAFLAIASGTAPTRRCLQRLGGAGGVRHHLLAAERSSCVATDPE